MPLLLLLSFQIVSIYIKLSVALNLMIEFQDDNFIEENKDILKEQCAETFNAWHYFKVGEDETLDANIVIGVSLQRSSEIQKEKWNKRIKRKRQE
jgi:hypothetical protein